MKGILIGIAVVIATVLLMYPIILNLLSRVSKLTVNLLDSNLETLQVLGSAIAKRDSDTDAHNYRVTIFSVRLAEAAGLDQHSIQKLIKGAFLNTDFSLFIFLSEFSTLDDNVQYLASTGSYSQAQHNMNSVFQISLLNCQHS